MIYLPSDEIYRIFLYAGTSLNTHVSRSQNGYFQGNENVWKTKFYVPRI